MEFPSSSGRKLIYKAYRPTPEDEASRTWMQDQIRWLEAAWLKQFSIKPKRKHRCRNE